MNKLISFVVSYPDWPRLCILLVTMFIFWNIEMSRLSVLHYEKKRHALLNFLFVFPAAPIQFFLGFLFVFAINWDGKNHFGLLTVLPSGLNLFVKTLFTIIALDFFEYAYHVMMHKVKLFWRIHLIHHADEKLDVTTTFREHPAETLIRLSFSLLIVFLLGVPFWIYILRQWIQIAFNVMQHSSIRLPKKINRIVSLIFITPNLHQVHHHYQLPYTDCNYGDIFSVWDRMFGTLALPEAIVLKYGIDKGIAESKKEKFIELLLNPFIK